MFAPTILPFAPLRAMSQTMRSFSSAGFTGPTNPAFAPVTLSTVSKSASYTFFAPRNLLSLTSFTSRSPSTHTMTEAPSAL